MATITVGSENTALIELYYEDHGHGQPVVLVHGYPLDGSSWELQARALLEAGHRVLTYDRRGFGRSSRTAAGYDVDTLAHDLDVLLETLDLHDVVLVGSSTGSGELARYVRRYGHRRVDKLAFLASLGPRLLQTPDNPTGVPRSVFEAIVERARADRYAWFTQFFRSYFNLDRDPHARVSSEVVAAVHAVATRSGPLAAHAVVAAWLEDFRDDVAAVRASGRRALILHGTADAVLPIDATGRPFHAAFPEAEYVELDGAPHGLLWTHAAEVNRALLDLVAR